MWEQASFNLHALVSLLCNTTADPFWTVSCVRVWCATDRVLSRAWSERTLEMPDRGHPSQHSTSALMEHGRGATLRGCTIITNSKGGATRRRSNSARDRQRVGRGRLRSGRHGPEALRGPARPEPRVTSALPADQEVYAGSPQGRRDDKWSLRPPAPNTGGYPRAGWEPLLRSMAGPQ